MIERGRTDEIQPGATRWSAGGWKIIACAALLLVTVPIAIISALGIGLHGVEVATSRTAVVAFLTLMVPFNASAMAAIWPNPLTRWIKERRRYFGIVFAMAMGVHIMCVIWLAVIDPKFPTGSPVRSFIFGGIALLPIVAMFVTSFDGPTDWLGPRRWRQLHTAGIWYLWSFFVLVFAVLMKFAPAMHAPLLLIALASGALRLSHGRRRAALRKRRIGLSAA